MYYAPSSLFFPVVPELLQFGVIALCGGVAILIAAAGRPYYRLVPNNYTDNHIVKKGEFQSPWHNDPQRCDPDQQSYYQSLNMTCLYAFYYAPEYITWAQLYNIFALLWLLFFIVGVCK